MSDNFYDISKLTIVLVNPVGSGNIGSVARAMKNMGVCRLVLVNPVEFHNNEAYEMACKARDVLSNATVFETLEGALSNSGFTIGASRRTGKKRQSYMKFDEGLKAAVKAMKNNEVCIVFGTEKNGLTNEELKLCQHKIAIPTDDNFASLNLSQAVLIFCYEIRRTIQSMLCRTSATDVIDKPSPVYMPFKELEIMYERLEIMLVKLGYDRNELVKKIVLRFRKIFSRTQLESRDYKMMMGVLSRVDALYEKIK